MSTKEEKRIEAIVRSLAEDAEHAARTLISNRLAKARMPLKAIVAATYRTTGARGVIYGIAYGQLARRESIAVARAALRRAKQETKRD